MVVGVVYLSACHETVDSGSIATSGIYADLGVTATGSGMSSVRARLLVGGSASNTTVELNEHDQLTVYEGDKFRQLTAISSFGETTYSASLDTEAEDALFKLSFIRTASPDQDCNAESAPNSVVSLPSPFTIDAPAPGTAVSRASSDVMIQWSPSGKVGTLSWQVSGTCLLPNAGSIDQDSGSYVITKQNFVPISGSEGMTCDATITVTRARTGMVDGAYGEGGNFSARQQRTLTVSSTP